MKYTIPETIVISKIGHEEVRDIIYHELTEQEFLVEYLKNPNLAYWTTDDDNNTKRHYKNGLLMATVRDGIVINHSMKKYP
jgi:hypothetical protein